MYFRDQNCPENVGTLDITGSYLYHIKVTLYEKKNFDNL